MIASYFLDLLSLVFGILSLIMFVRTDRTIPYIEARKRSIKKDFLCLLLFLLSMMAAAGFKQPDNVETALACSVGGLIVLAVSYGIAYLQVTFLGRNETARKVYTSIMDRSDKNKK